MAHTGKQSPVNGVAHCSLTVSSMERSTPFYRAMCEYFGWTCVLDNMEIMVYHVGGRTALAIQPAAEEYREDRFVQRRVGLHHICWRLRSKEEIDKFQKFLEAVLVPLGGTIVHAAEEGPFAPGYYSILFEDPDGIRLEVNHVPGRGLFALEKPQVMGGYGEPPGRSKL